MSTRKEPAQPIDGAAHLRAMTALYGGAGVNPQPHQPRVGEVVAVDGLPGEFEVADVSDPSLVVLRASNGATFKAGWRTIRRVSQ